MGINGQQATACYGGLGSYVHKGENRVNDLECHANCLRERLDRLESMLPNALIEASLAIQKGEQPPDFLQLARAEEVETQDVQSSDCREVLGAENDLISLEDEPPNCVLQVLARKEKRLRKKIYEMEVKEERYKRALAESGQIFNAAEADDADCEELPVMRNSSLEEFCKKCCGYNEKVPKLNLPQDPEAWKTLAGQFKAAYKKAETEGLPPGVREPIRKTAEKIRAMSNFNPNSCPCGQPIKCNSCVICSCAEWERDLEGGGDEPPEESSSDGQESRKIIIRKSKPKDQERCHCGCNETSSESDCPCGCSGFEPGIIARCPCDCGRTIESSATSSSDPSSTITDTTIPSFETDDSSDGINNLEKEVENLCDICGNEELKITFANEGENMCKVCPCVCATCAGIENGKQFSPGIGIEGPISKDVFIDDENAANVSDVVECSCPSLTEVPQEIRKLCRVDQLREGIENLKNRNHALREILKSCGGPSHIDDSKLSEKSRENMVPNYPVIENNGIKQTTSGLMCTVKFLQSKCRTKDGMIVALADELKKAATPEQTSRILECLADPSLCHRVNDFDRSELWNYLKNSTRYKPLDSGYPEADDLKPDHCPCPINPKNPNPPREFTVRGRVSGDGLIVSWLPPLSGPFSGYEVLAEGEIVARIRTPMRTETFIGGLDLRGLVLLEVRTITRNGLRSKTVEKLFNPARSKV